MTKCEPCPRDTYQPKNASIKCEPCPLGTKTYDTVGSTTVSQCLRGNGIVLSTQKWSMTLHEQNTRLRQNYQNITTTKLPKKDN